MWNAWNQVSNLQTINEASPQTCAGFEDERHPCAKGRAHRADQFQLSNGLCAHSGSGVVLNHQGSCHELVNVHEDSRAQSSLGVDAGCGRLVVKAPGKANNMVATNTPGLLDTHVVTCSLAWSLMPAAHSYSIILLSQITVLNIRRAVLTKSGFHKLFGTAERAASTLSSAMPLNRSVQELNKAV